jgi:hypothetical protein
MVKTFRAHKDPSWLAFILNKKSWTDFSCDIYILTYVYTEKCPNLLVISTTFKKIEIRKKERG